MASFFYVPNFQEYWEKPIYSPSAQDRSQAKASKRILVHRKIHTFQVMVKNGSPKLKALLGKLWHPLQALFSAKGPDLTLCDFLKMRSSEILQQIETGRDGSFITEINACSQNH